MILALLLAAAAPPQAADAPAAPAASLAPDAESRWVVFELTPGNQIRFPMMLDGRPVVAVLDTGVSHSVLSRRYAQAHGLPVKERGQATAIGGSVALGSVATRELVLGGLRRTGGELSVAALPAAATGDATAVDLLVGRDLTAPYALDIDYAARRFRLLPSGRMPFAGAVAPLSIAPDRLVYVTELAIGGTRLRPVVVDTGDGSAVTLSAASWKAARIAGGAVTDTVSYGLLGPVVTEIAVAPELTLGTQVARDVQIGIEPAGGFSDTIRVAGRIGSGLLQDYRVLLDPGARHMVLARQANPRSPVRSTSGLLLGLAGDRLRVLHVMRGGPAAALGLRAGDTICRVDDRPVSRPSAGGDDWATGTPGRIVRLSLCAGGERQLQLRRFY